MTHTDDSRSGYDTWTLELYDDDGGVVEQRELKVQRRSGQPFNSDGFWKAILLDRDGRHLRSVPLVAIETEATAGRFQASSALWAQRKTPTRCSAAS